MGWPAMYIDVPDPQGFVFTQAFQSIGLGLAGAIGAAVARPDRLTVAALGDGARSWPPARSRPSAGWDCRCWSSSTTARPTAPRSTTSVPSANRSTSSPSPTPTSPLWAGPPAPRVTVRRVEDLAAVERWISDRRGPLVVDAKVEPTVVAEWLSEAFRAH